jgi:alkyl hydroperoxide reductase subunit F
MVLVRVYSTKNCPYCRMTKAFLEKYNVPYEDIDVGENKEAARELVEKSGQFGVPVILWEDEVIVGFDAEKLNRLVGKEATSGDFDVLIIGAGPAGLTAAMYCARKSLTTAVVSADIGGQALWSWSIDNYMGYRMITGEELMKRFEEQVKELPIHLEVDRVVSVEKAANRYRAETVSGKSITTTSLILATGKRPRTLGLENEDAYIGRGVSVCSTCDGPLYKGKRIAVVGGGNSALQTAIEMSGIATWVYLIVRSKIRADEIVQEVCEKKENITILLHSEVINLHGTPLLTAITVKDREGGIETKIDVDGLFLEIGLLPNTEFLDDFVEMNETREVVVDENCHTNLPGVYAAGDATSIHGKQVIIAAGEGAKAALEAYDYVMKHP